MLPYVLEVLPFFAGAIAAIRPNVCDGVGAEVVAKVRIKKFEMRICGGGWVRALG